MDYLITCIHENHNLTIIPHYYLVPRDTMTSHPGCSSAFAYQLAKYLVNKVCVSYCWAMLSLLLPWRILWEWVVCTFKPLPRPTLLGSLWALELLKKLINHSLKLHCTTSSFQLEDMGAGESAGEGAQDRSTLYARLFKLLFGSIQSQGFHNLII